MCAAIYIGKNQHTPKKIMDSNFSDLLYLLKNGQESDSFSDHFEQHFLSNTPRPYLRKYMAFKLVKQLNLIGAIIFLLNLTATYV